MQSTVPNLFLLKTPYFSRFRPCFYGCLWPKHWREGPLETLGKLARQLDAVAKRQGLKASKHARRRLVPVRIW
jgi:hypothetical protein